jgi:ATP-dependent DNA helicase DinG
MTSLSHTASAFFSPDGALASLTGYEHRPQQETMARTIAEALGNQSHVIIEAPTGVGKTLAYLVPAILFAVQEGRKAIISTHTKNLQEQIFKKDIPLVRAALGLDFRVSVLKGRRNYLCTSRLRNALASTGHLFEKDELSQLHRIRDWSHTTIDGDLENLGFNPDPLVWDLVCSEKDLCSSSLCKSECFFQQARERAKSAHVLILNHALFFSLWQSQESDAHFIFPDDFVVFDEAQTLEAIAAAGLGMSVSRFQALGAVHKLYNPRSKKGLLANEKAGVRSACEGAERAIMEFFDRAGKAAMQLPDSGRQPREGAQREVRIRVPHLLANTVTDELAELQAVLKKLEEQAGNDFREQELAAARRVLQEVDTSIRDFLNQKEADCTYWIEVSGGRSDNVTLCSSPTEIAERIGPRLFREGTSVIMTSATLTVSGELHYFQSRMGATGVAGLVLDSPFDHARQMRVTLLRDIAEPDKGMYASQLATRIMQSLDRSSGKALVLFTSNVVMQATAKALGPDLEERGWMLLVQGKDVQRHVLLEEFKRDIHSVLFGLDSFWMGVDVPGEALEHVIITRLPFAVPNHPLVEARLELIETRGGNPFMEFSLPEAILKFRQGVGRLLRSRTDTGMITILDSRILTRRYGRSFLASIPRCPIEILSADGETDVLPIDEW